MTSWRRVLAGAGKLFSHRNLSSDDSAQLHILEVVIGGLLVIAAILAATDIYPRTSQSDSGRSQLEILAEDSLRSLDNLPPAGVNATSYRNSSLVYFCSKADVAALTGFFNSSLEERVSYAFSCYNHSEDNGDEALLFGFETSSHILSNTATSHRIVVYQTFIYDFTLVLWLEPRAVIP